MELPLKPVHESWVTTLRFVIYQYFFVDHFEHFSVIDAVLSCLFTHLATVCFITRQISS